MKINVSKDSCEFIKNEEKRKTICLIHVNPDMVDSFIREIITLPIIWNDSIKNLLRMDEKFIGVATCAEEDTWDDEVGELVAYEKAKEKFAKAFFRAVDGFFNYFDSGLDKVMNTCNTIGEAWETNLGNLRQKISQKIGEEPPQE